MHAAAVVVWIGGLAMATTVILPLVWGKEWPAEKRLILFEAIERRFVWQARTAVVLVGLSGFYMVSRYDLWNRFAYLPGELEARVAAFVEHYNHARDHESLGNLTPADVYFGRGEAILQERARIKRQTLMDRRLRHHAQGA